MTSKINPFFMAVALAVLIGATLSWAQTPRPPLNEVKPPAFERVGQTGWQFLHLPTVARNAALAGVISGLKNNDVMAVYANPANLVDVKNMDAGFTKINYVADISYMTAAVAKNFGSLGVFGLTLASLDAGDMIRTENLFNESENITERSGDLGTFTSGDLLIGLAYARTVTDRLSIGGHVSYIEETLDETKVKNWNVDFGVHFRTGFRSLRFSLVARNFGADKEFTGFTEIYGVPQTVRMPLDFRIGVGYDLIEKKAGRPHQLATYLEGVHVNDGPERVHAALEYTFLDMFNLRGGYRFNYDEQGLTLGGGLNYNMKNITGRIDYAYLDYGRLQSVHMFTLGFAFGK
ncbi:MAG TPA: PorV/PorQ family protein [bacterium]|nr:PorV/PorQ family protein [bacterium]HPR88467.1 PorV/PorQ family protein [bacterium]